MSLYTRTLHTLGEKEARTVEKRLDKAIKECREKLRIKTSENKSLKELMLKQEERHIEGIVLISNKLEDLTTEVSDLRREAQYNRELSAENRALFETSNEERMLFQGLLEAVMKKNPEIRLSKFLKEGTLTDDI